MVLLLGLGGYTLLSNFKKRNADVFQVVQNRMSGQYQTYTQERSVFLPWETAQVFPTDFQHGAYTLTNLATHDAQMKVSLTLNYHFYVSPQQGETLYKLLESCPPVPEGKLTPEAVNAEKVNRYIQQQLNQLKPQIEQYFKSGTPQSFIPEEVDVGPILPLWLTLSKQLEAKGINLTFDTHLVAFISTDDTSTAPKTIELK